MRKDEADASAPGLARSRTKPIRKDCASPSGAQLAAGKREDSVEASTRSAEQGTDATFRSHRELGAAILAAGNPVKVGCELLDKETSEDRGAANRLKALQTFADWAFEKPGVDGYRKPPRIIWDIPGPPYEPVDPELLAAGALEEDKLEGGEK